MPALADARTHAPFRRCLDGASKSQRQQQMAEEICRWAWLSAIEVRRRRVATWRLETRAANYRLARSFLACVDVSRPGPLPNSW